MTAHSPYASAKATIRRLQEFEIYTKKSLGQHFLVDDGVVGKILKLAALKPGDKVLEIGPGIGTLTEALLLAGTEVTAIEKDLRLEPLLADIAFRYPHKFTYRLTDALELDVLPNTNKMVSNLPYAVAATIILEYFQRLPSLQSATVMVQREVAERMAAKPGSKSYGAYSVKLQLLAESKASFSVASSCFLPPPRVDSAVIRLERCTTPCDADLAAAVFVVVEAAFAERRKTIRNSMRAYFAQRGLDVDLVDAVLERADISPTIRGEALGLEKFVELGRCFAASKL